MAFTLNLVDNIAVFEYNSIKQSLYRFKYFGRIEYARFYADVTYSQWHREIMCWKPEAIVPVPLVLVVGLLVVLPQAANVDTANAQAKIVANLFFII